MATDSSLKYDLRGVSANKEEVHAAIKNLDKGLYPTAFCKILPDITGGDEEWCNIMHADTAGTKTSLAYLYWKETGDISIWRDIVQDAIVMNLDDLACVGALNNVVFSSTIGRNKSLISGEVLSELINSTDQFLNSLKPYGVNCILAGGETADVGDIVRTIDCGFTAFVRMKKEDLVINQMKPGDVIVGFASYGQSTYENEYNSGIGSNGLTSARHDTLSKHYAENYTESFDPAVPDEVVFTGNLRMTDIESETQLPVGKLLLSPTRSFTPVLKPILDELKSEISGMIHCTGGAQTKVLKFVENLHIIKDNLLETPPVFKMIQHQSQTAWKEMYQVFNMGHRLEIYTDAASAERMIEIAEGFNIEAKVIGRCEALDENKLTISSIHGIFEYS